MEKIRAVIVYLLRLVLFPFVFLAIVPFLIARDVLHLIRVLSRRARGVCPRCAGQPPHRDNCQVCLGMIFIGHKPPPEIRALWAERYATLLRGEKAFKD
jgi:hypothetical protein